MQVREGVILLVPPTLVTLDLSNAVRQFFFFLPQATFLTADVGNTVTTANNPTAKLIIGLLGIIVGPTVIVGLTCTPISVIGGGGSW